PPFNVNKLAQVAALASLEDTEHLEKSISIAKTGRDNLYEELLQIKGLKVYPSQGNFLLVNTPGRTDVADLLLKKGIIVRDGSSFRGLSDEYFRVSIGTATENELFLEALKEIIC
ncbi:MAG: aminotransferase class I/II-fold pyridoxal phosphate-dependent enzyme, partial [Candidatus Hydrothermarchaeales archaeon]